MKVNDLFEFFTTFEGIFAYLVADGEEGRYIPWGLDYDSSLLDLEYHGSISGGKEITPLVERLLTLENEDLPRQVTLQIIGDMIYNHNIKRWTELYNTLSYEYNPIENYSMTETHTGTDTSTQTPSNWKTTNEALQADNESVNDTSVYAFNSSNELPTGKTKSKTKNKNEVTQSGTYETETEYNTTLTRSGNIGVTTSQQMIQSQRDLVKWDFFREVVFPDIDKILCLGVY